MTAMNHSDEPPAGRRPLVLASSRTGPDDLAEIAAGRRPRLDYLVVADALGADVLDTRLNERLPAWRRRAERALASDIAQARTAWNRRGAVSAWLSTSEKVGLPLALMGHAPVPHVLIAHNVSTARKRLMHQVTGALSRFDAVICLSRTQETFLRETLRLPESRVHRISDSIDDHFFRPAPVLGEGAGGGGLLAVGRENRDYETLIEAAKLLDLPLTIVSSSLWSSRGLKIDETNLPPGVTLRQDFVPYPELRALYEASRLVVVPLAPCDYAAGVNGALEAMAMGKAVIVTRTRGLAEYVRDGVTGRLVPAGDVRALAAAVKSLWDDAPARAALGRNARAFIEAEGSMDGYARRVAQIVQNAMEEKRH